MQPSGGVLAFDTTVASVNNEGCVESADRNRDIGEARRSWPFGHRSLEAAIHPIRRQKRLPGPRCISYEISHPKA